MMRNTAFTFAMTALLFLFGCSILGGEMTYDQAMEKNQNRLNDNRDLLEDARFLVEMQSFGMMLNAIGDTVAGRAYARKVAEFGKEISEKMEFYLEDLEKVADDKDIVLPEELSDMHRRELNYLIDADRDNFDEVFLTTLESQLQKQRRQTERMATEAFDDDIRAWTARQIKMMKDYEEKADRMEDELLTD